MHDQAGLLVPLLTKNGRLRALELGSFSVLYKHLQRLELELFVKDLHDLFGTHEHL